MRFGHFDDGQREYVIDRPDTPLPWINYLGSEKLHGIISNTAGGYTFYKDARLRRLTRYRYNDAPLGGNGRYLYVRDNNPPTADQATVWTPMWLPMRSPYDKYECRHGLGYTQISSSYAGITTAARYFIPLGADLEIWDLHFENQREFVADLSLVGAVEFNLWDALDDASNFQRNYSTGEVEVEGNLIIHKTEYRERRNHIAFLACSEDVAAFDTQREAFLGPYRGWDKPLGLEQGELSDSIAHGWQPIGAQQLRLALEPGESRRIVFLLGYHENAPDQKFENGHSQRINKEGLRSRLVHYLDPDRVDSAFADLAAFWDGLLSKFQVSTPDEHTDRMVNIWNQYQLMVTFNMSRSASLFESGIGRGMGFRDSNQDLLGNVLLIPARARERILDLAATQFESGGAYHQYQPLTKRGNGAVGGNFNDDPLWLPLAVAAYIKESGDWTILDEQVPYDNQPGSEESLYLHLKRSLEYTLARLGPHDLPLIGRADWNDCLNLNCFSSEPGESFQTVEHQEGGVAESIFIAGLFVLAGEDSLPIVRQRGDAMFEQRLQQALEAMRQAILSAGWDGAWFRRAYDHYGDPIGSQQCAQGQIFIETQGMSVMAGLGLEDGRARQALNAVKQQLATEHGIMLHQPAYTDYQLRLGEITSYPPGYKENAGIFCHTNPWIMIAEAKLRRPEKAFDYYQRINPSFREAISEVHKCEPYVYSQMIAGRDAPTHGEAKNSWLTGTASWNFVAISQWILGIRPDYQGLIIDPVIPEAWPGFKATRSFRGKTYSIEVKRVGPGKEFQLVVDGRTIEGNLIPANMIEEPSIQVECLIGTSEANTPSSVTQDLERSETTR